MAGPYAFVTLVSSDAYLPGALALAAALRDVHPDPPPHPDVPFQTVCLVTPETVDVATIKLLRRAFDLVIGVEVIQQEDDKNLKLLGRPDLTTVLTKLHVFRLVQYSKIIFLDADVLPIRSLSHLFNIKHEFAAAPDVGWPDIFNSGVLVLSPGEDKFNELKDLLKSKGSWDGGDQGLLNEWRAGNWHRLSFTYNTTPTAAYTYAPAYERYGSQINVIHFIGSNKPWKAIPFRSPFIAEKRAAPDPSSIQQAYDYESLVDRWFAVYDKHYRSQPIASPSFEVKRYPSAWDTSNSPTPSAGGLHQNNVLSLEDLRRMAIEGMNAAALGATSSSYTQPGEGEYRSMPLEGRFDLMRPRKERRDDRDGASAKTDSPPIPELGLDPLLLNPDVELPMTPIVRHLNLPDDPPRWQTLPTPNPSEIPPSPKPTLKSLPATPSPAPDYYASSAGQTSDSEGGYGAESSSGQMGEWVPHLFSQAMQTPLKDGPLAEAPSIFFQVHKKGDSNNRTPNQHSPAPEHQRRNGQHAHENSHRPSSPPLLSWNPAVEPPPKDLPAFSSFPSDTYFKNAWDETTRKASISQTGSPDHPSGFFQPPPPAQIPEVLRAEGHYRSVIGEGALSPDRNKVKPVFPWEDKPRQLPGRVFPDSDAPPAALFVSPAGNQTSGTVIHRTPENKPIKRSHPLSPLHGPPGSLSYSNAWDSVPSIQSYASRLVRPSQPAPTLAPAFDDGHYQNKGRGKSWDEQIEASSRDGDDEDEGDDNDIREPDSDDDKRSRSRPRSRSAFSVAEDTRQVQHSAQKVYRTQGVQTIPREKRSQGVQVSILTESIKSRDQSRRHSLSGKRPVATASGSLPNRPTQEFLGKLIATPAPDSNPPPFIKLPSSPSSSPPRLNREFITSPSSNSPVKVAPAPVSDTPKISTPPRTGASHKPMTPPKASSPPKAPSPLPRPSIQTNHHRQRTGKAPAIVARQISNDSSIGSPASSVGPVSPRDDQPITGSIRKGTRVWDPARGVELFKRGSEEVLARFLKMGSWDETSR